MKYITTIALALGFAASVAFAADEAALVGKVQCAKCTLKTQDKCQAALVVTKEGKELVYLLTGKDAAGLHKDVCKPGSSVDVKITGKITKDVLAISMVEKK